METLLEMLQKGETATLGISSGSEITEEFAVSELNRSSDVVAFKCEDISPLLSPTNLNTSSAFSQEWHLSIDEDEATMAGIGEILYVICA